MRKTLVPVIVMAAAAAFAVDAAAKKPPAGKHAAAAKQAPAEPVAVDVPPPSGTWEATPAPAQGYVWSAGFYDWQNGHYVWKPGEWVLAKDGMDYRQHKWVQRPDHKWVLTGGDWVKAPENVAGKQ